MHYRKIVKEFEDKFSIKTPSIRISKKYRDIFDDKLELYMLAFAFDIQFIIDCPFEKTPAKKYFVQFENYKIVKHDFLQTNNDPDPKEFKAFLKDIISQYIICTKYRFENKKRNFLSCNHTNIYKNNIKKLFDIDAFYGILQYQEATKSLKFGLNVELSNKKKINNKFFIQKDEKIINIKDLQHFYLGKFVLGKTIINVFLCFTRKRLFEEILKIIIKYIENNKNKTVEHNIMFRTMNVENCLKFYLPNILISEFLLATVKRGFIFLESYGNKLDTCHEDIVLALKNIQNYFNLQEFTNFYIDFACTVLPVENVMIFPKNEFFKEYNVKPNYNLFFCKNLNNANQNLYYIKKNKLILGKSLIKKINFYSCFEDIIARVKKRSFIPQYTNRKIENAFYGQRLGLKSKKTVVFQNFEKVKDNLKRMSGLGYRFEISLPYDFAFMEMSKLVLLIDQSEFTYLDSKDTFLMVENVFNELHTLNADNIDSCFSSICKESLFVNNFLKGSQNLNLLNFKIKKD